ncbi:MAG: SIMPL domain-containing protein [Cyanobacteria bacterium HKST-UBA03]|nr:SIMPL domain-containing protein [Cyanobacteria bacterium HKST-UBA03]
MWFRCFKRVSPLMLSALVVLTLVGPARWVPAAAASSELPSAKLITTQGSGEVQVPPDSVRLNVAVQHRAATQKEAQRLTNAATQQVISAVKALGYKNMTLSTQAIRVYPEYSQRRGDELSKVIGYQASNDLEITVSNLGMQQVNEAGSRLVDTALNNGATNLNNFQAFVYNMDPYKKEALAEAIRDARQNADIMAAAAGVRVVGVQAISGSPSFSAPPVFYARAMKADMVSSGESAPVETKASKITSQVSVTFIFE